MYHWENACFLHMVSVFDGLLPYIENGPYAAQIDIFVQKPVLLVGPTCPHVPNYLIRINYKQWSTHSYMHSNLCSETGWRGPEGCTIQTRVSTYVSKAYICTCMCCFSVMCSSNTICLHWTWVHAEAYISRCVWIASCKTTLFLHAFWFQDC